MCHYIQFGHDDLQIDLHAQIVFFAQAMGLCDMSFIKKILDLAVRLVMLMYSVLEYSKAMDLGLDWLHVSLAIG